MEEGKDVSLLLLDGNIGLNTGCATTDTSACFCQDQKITTQKGTKKILPKKWRATIASSSEVFERKVKGGTRRIR